MVYEKLITNCSVTVLDVENANRIFGADLANLRGKGLGPSRNMYALNTS